MKPALYGLFLLAMLAAIAALLILPGPVPPAAPVRLAWPDTPVPPPPLALVSLRTMNETSFLKVIGILHNRGVEPIGPIVVRGWFTSRDGMAVNAATVMPEPEILVPGAAVRFELIGPEHPATGQVAIDFRLLSGAPLPVDGTQVELDGRKLP